MALVAGKQAAPSCTMGHAGAFIAHGENDAAGKSKALETAGAVLTNHPSKFGAGMKSLLASRAGVNVCIVRINILN